MTKTTNRTIHVLLSGTHVVGDRYGARIGLRGQTFEISEEQYERSKDRNGNSWLDLTPEEQIARWGVQRIADGPAPEGMEIGADDVHGIRYRRYENERELAAKISDPSERKAEFARIKAEYPEQARPSRNTMSYPERDGGF